MSKKRFFMNVFKRAQLLIILPALMFLSSSGLAIIKTNSDETLSYVISDIVQLMRENGYEMPNYRIVKGHTDVPVSGTPEKHAFFGYITKESTIILKFYEADNIPYEARASLIRHLIDIYRDNDEKLTIFLYMTTEKYKKLKLTKPKYFLELLLTATSK